MQFVVTAYDYTDSDALNRRLEHREKHLSGLDSMSKNGTFFSGGAILDDAGKMIGSSVHIAFSSRKELDEWIKNDPYIIGKVWEHVDIKEVKLFLPKGI